MKENIGLFELNENELNEYNLVKLKEENIIFNKKNKNNKKV